MTFDDMFDAVIEAKNCGFDEAIFVGNAEAATIHKGARDGLVQLVGLPPRVYFAGLPVYRVDAAAYFRVS